MAGMKKTNDHAEPTTRLCGFTVNGNYCKLKHAAGTVAIAEYCMNCFRYALYVLVCEYLDFVL